MRRGRFLVVAGSGLLAGCTAPTVVTRPPGLKSDTVTACQPGVGCNTNVGTLVGKPTLASGAYAAVYKSAPGQYNGTAYNRAGTPIITFADTIALSGALKTTANAVDSGGAKILVNFNIPQPLPYDVYDLGSVVTVLTPYGAVGHVEKNGVVFTCKVAVISGGYAVSLTDTQGFSYRDTIYPAGAMHAANPVLAPCVEDGIQVLVLGILLMILIATLEIPIVDIATAAGVAALAAAWQQAVNQFIADGCAG